MLDLDNYTYKNQCGYISCLDASMVRSPLDLVSKQNINHEKIANSLYQKTINFDRFDDHRIWNFVLSNDVNECGFTAINKKLFVDYTGIRDLLDLLINFKHDCSFSAYIGPEPFVSNLGSVKSVGWLSEKYHVLLKDSWRIQMQNFYEDLESDLIKQSMIIEDKQEGLKNWNIYHDLLKHHQKDAEEGFNYSIEAGLGYYCGLFANNKLSASSNIRLDVLNLDPIDPIKIESNPSHICFTALEYLTKLGLLSTNQLQKTVLSSPRSDLMSMLLYGIRSFSSQFLVDMYLPDLIWGHSPILNLFEAIDLAQSFQHILFIDSSSFPRMTFVVFTAQKR